MSIIPCSRRANGRFGPLFSFFLVCVVGGRPDAEQAGPPVLLLLLSALLLVAGGRGGGRRRLLALLDGLGNIPVQGK